MTLETTAPPLAFPEDFIPNSPSQKRKYYTLPHPLKYPESNGSSQLIKDGFSLSRHRVLNRTASGNTFLTMASGLSTSAWMSTDSVDYSKERKPSFKTRYESTSDAKQLQSHHSASLQGYRNERAVNSSSITEQSKTGSRRYGSSSGAKPTQRGSRSTLEHLTLSRSATFAGEIVLDFPDASDLSCHSSPGKRPEKNKEPKTDRTHRSLHHSVSMPGLIDDSIKDFKSSVADTKFTETTTRSFFLFFRKKNKANNDRSPSPCIPPNPQNIPKRPSKPYPIPQSRYELTLSPSFKDLRSPGQSPASSKRQQNSFSSNVAQAPSSHFSLVSPAVSTSNSPTSTHNLPKYMPRSRSKHRRESRRKSSKREQMTHPEDRLRHEDLPPHPSLYKKTIEKTNSCPNTPALKSHTNRIISNKISYRSNTESRLRRNSMPESSTEVKDTAEVKDAAESSESSQNVKDSKMDSAQNLRKKSLESTSKTTSEDCSNCELTTSSSDQQQRRSILSQSVPSFGGDNYIPDTDLRVISDAEDFEYNPTDMTGSLSLSLCGCGFLGMYHLGVVSCLAQRGPSFIERLEKFSGASAGAIMAAILVTSRDKIEESVEHLQKLAKEIRKKPLGPITPGYNFTRSLRYMLDDILPEDAHETAQGKLFVSVTNAETKKNEMLSDFTSRNELIEALVASSYIPLYAGIKIPTIRGKKYIDGGLSNNMPRFETGRTITVSPFDGKSDIGPKLGQEAEKKAHFINLQNQDLQVSVNNVKKGAQAFFPPKRQALQDYFEKGRYDTNRFLIREGLFEVAAPPQNNAVLYESSV